MRPVLLLAGTNDRIIIACARALKRKNHPFYICLPQGKLGLWRFTAYRTHLLSHGYARKIGTGEFKRSLARVVETTGPVVLFPSSESRTRFLLQDTDWLEENNIQLPTPDHEIYTTVSDKESFARLVRSYGIAIPSAREELPAQDKLPFVAKPRRNLDEKLEKYSPQLLFTERSYEQFRRREDASRYFYQEFIEGPSYYYCVLYNKGMKVVDFVQRTVCQQPFGKAVIKACSATLPQELVGRTDRLFMDLAWTGVVMVEFKERGDRLYMIEANPRLWGPLQLAVDNGVDFPDLLHSLAMRSEQGRAGYGVSASSQFPLPEASSTCGYLWLAGFVKCFWYRLRGGRMVRYPEKNCDYRDVWLRRDTWPFFVLEMLKKALNG